MCTEDSVSDALSKRVMVQPISERLAVCLALIMGMNVSPFFPFLQDKSPQQLFAAAYGPLSTPSF